MAVENAGLFRGSGALSDPAVEQAEKARDRAAQEGLAVLACFGDRARTVLGDTGHSSPPMLLNLGL